MGELEGRRADWCRKRKEQERRDMQEVALEHKKKWMWGCERGDGENGMMLGWLTGPLKGETLRKMISSERVVKGGH